MTGCEARKNSLAGGRGGGVCALLLSQFAATHGKLPASAVACGGIRKGFAKF